MNYSYLLKKSYVVNLTEALLNVNCANNSIIEIIHVKQNFYIKDINNNLTLICPNMIDKKVKNILNTVHYFEKYKRKPFDSYITRKCVIPEYYIDNNLLKELQLQYSIDKNYFD
jgi:hypothetical protein